MNPDQIEFRAKRLDNQEWIFGYYYVYGDKHIICNERYQADYPIGYPHEVIPETLGQYIGINYKSTNEKMFTGDIVNGGIYNGSYRLGKIVFDKNEFIAHSIGRFAEGTSEDFQYFEKVGTIYDNKELL